MKRKIQKLIDILLHWLDELLFPENVLCLCCDMALGEDAEDGICPSCARALQRMNLAQEEKERIAPGKTPDRGGFCLICV